MLSGNGCVPYRRPVRHKSLDKLNHKRLYGRSLGMLHGRQNHTIRLLRRPRGRRILFVIVWRAAVIVRVTMRDRLLGGGGKRLKEMVDAMRR